MKTLILIIAVLLHVQPAAAGGCDMGGEPVPGGSMDQAMEHPLEGGHDCCDEQPADPTDSCDHGIECSTCTAGVSAVAVAQVLTLPHVAAHRWEEALAADIPNHSFPLFKPPI